MASALAALAKGPGISGEPGVLERRNPGFAAAPCVDEGDNLKAQALGVCERKFVLAIERETVLLGGDVIVTPGAEPIAGSVIEHGERPGLSFWENDRRS
jgi:hypothetical protein